MEKLWSVKELATQTGLSERCLRQLIAEGRLPIVRFQGMRAVRVRHSSVEALVQTSEQPVAIED